MSGSTSVPVNDAARTLAESLTDAGYRRLHPRRMQAHAGEGLLAGSPRRAGGAVTVQWDVRADRLGAVPDAVPLTARCLVNAAWVGHRPSSSPLEDLFEALRACGLDPTAVSYRLSAADLPGEHVRSALTALGVPQAQVRSDGVGHHPSTPRWMRRPADVSLTLELPVGPPCSASCAPGCLCGRYLHLGDCRFAPAARGRSERPERGAPPAFEFLAAADALNCAASGLRDPFDLPLLRDLREGAAALLPEIAAGPHPGRDLRVVVDHTRAVALLLAAGFVPGAQGHGHSLRTLLRGAAGVVLAARAATAPLADVVSLAAALHAFPPVTRDSVRLLVQETAAFERAVQAGYAALRECAERRATPEQLTATLVRLRARDGIPLGLTLTWCKREGIGVPLAPLAAADQAARW